MSLTKHPIDKQCFLKPVPVFIIKVTIILTISKGMDCFINLLFLDSQVISLFSNRPFIISIDINYFIERFEQFLLFNNFRLLSFIYILKLPIYNLYKYQLFH